ncbi:MAG: DMT family transporter [Bellilinea sp.]
MQADQPYSRRIKFDGFLVLTALVWGSGFVAQRIAAASMGSYTFNAGRFILGAVIVFSVAGFRWQVQKDQLRWMGLAGLVLFCGSTLQQLGMKTTTAGNAGFLTSLYVVIIPFLLLVFARQKIQAVIWVAIGLAALGALLLSTGGQYQPAPGDWLVLAGALFWAAHVIIVGTRGRQSEPLMFTVGQFAVAAVINLIFALLFDYGKTAPQPEAWLALLYSAVVPVGIGFTLQVIGQRHAPPIDAALIFSLEAVFAALIGYLILNERLLPIQLLGCGLILLAIIITQINSYKQIATNKIGIESQDLFSE